MKNVLHTPSAAQSKDLSVARKAMAMQIVGCGDLMGAIVSGPDASARLLEHVMQVGPRFLVTEAT